jgi:hypothetical protein
MRAARCAACRRHAPFVLEAAAHADERVDRQGARRYSRYGRYGRVAFNCREATASPPTSAPGLGSPLPHLRRDWAHPCRICAGTGLTPAAPAPGPSVPVFTAVPASRCFPVLLVRPTVSRSLLQMVACAYASDVISLISILYHSRRAYRRNGVIQMNPKVIRHGYGDCALHSTRNCQQLLH